MSSETNREIKTNTLFPILTFKKPVFNEKFKLDMNNV